MLRGFLKKVHRSSSLSSSGDDDDTSGQGRYPDGDPGYMSDTNYVLDEETRSLSSRTFLELGLNKRELQNHDQDSGEQAYLGTLLMTLGYIVLLPACVSAACVRLGIVPATFLLSRLSSECLSLRHALLNPASAVALSEGLSVNRCIKTLNLGSNLLGDKSALTLLEAISGSYSLAKLDLSRNLLSDKFGERLARSLSSPLCSLRELVLADNFFTDCFTYLLSKEMATPGVRNASPLKNLDVSNNKIRDGSNEALASILCCCSRLGSLNLSWNDLGADPPTDQWCADRGRNLAASFNAEKGRSRGVSRFPFVRAALARPGRLVTLELSFNGLPDDFGMTVGSMLGDNASLAVLDLSRNRLGKSSALSIAEGLKKNRALRTLKLGWNDLGREGTLGIIGAIGHNQGPLEVVRLENTTNAGMEFEAAREAEAAVARRVTGTQWVEVVCEYPDRARAKGNSLAGPVSWMTEEPPVVDTNTTYITRHEHEREGHISTAGGGELTEGSSRTSFAGGGGRPNMTRSGAPLPTTPTPSSKTPRRTLVENTDGKSRGSAAGGAEDKEEQRHLAIFSPAKEAVAVPVLSVRLKLRAREAARLEEERLLALEAIPAAKRKERQPNRLSYLRPLNKTVRQRTLAKPSPRLLFSELKDSANGRVTSTEERKRGSRGRGSTPRSAGQFEGRRTRAREQSGSSLSVPEYRQRASQGARGREQHTGGIASQHGRSGQRSESPLVLGRTSNPKTKASHSGSQRSVARGRSRSSSRHRGSATRSRPAHTSTRRPDTRRGRRRTRSKSAINRRRNRRNTEIRPPCPAIAAIVQAVAPPSRLKLRGKQHEY